MGCGFVISSMNVPATLYRFLSVIEQTWTVSDSKLIHTQSSYNGSPTPLVIYLPMSMYFISSILLVDLSYRFCANKICQSRVCERFLGHHTTSVSVY